MATTIVKFRANDGSEWNDLKSAERRDEICFSTFVAMSGLPDINVPGDKYYQHNREELFQARRNVWELVKTHILKDDWPIQRAWDADSIHPHSLIGRILGDSDCSPLNDAWYRFMCCDFETCRQYQQPFYALNPDKAPTEQMN